MRTVYIPETPEFWCEFLLAHSDQYGGNLPGFSGSRFQRGRGLGSFFRGLFRMAVPVLKKAAKAVGKEALKTGVGVLSDVARGGDALQSLETHGREAVAVLADKAQKHIKEQSGGALGKRVKINRSAKITKSRRESSSARQTKAGKRKKKKQKNIYMPDIFGDVAC